MVMDASSLSFDAASFDSVLVFASLHHMQAKDKALAEMHRVLRPSGTLMLLYEPSYPSYWLVRENGKYSPCREDHGYVSSKRYMQLLRAAGFFPRVYEYDQGYNEDVLSQLVKGLKLTFLPSSVIILAKKQ